MPLSQLLTNSCATFATMLFYDLTGILIYQPIPLDLGWDIASLNRGGKGKRPKSMGGIGTVPKLAPVKIGGGART